MVILCIYIFFNLQHSKTSFPLCMRFLHEALRNSHHLRHGGRLQYGLFLKGIGVTLQDAMRFWRDEFTKLMDVDKVTINFAYIVWSLELLL